MAKTKPKGAGPVPKIPGTVTKEADGPAGDGAEKGRPGAPELSDGARAVLGCIERTGTLRGVSPGGIVRYLPELEAAGLVEVEADGNVRLTTE
jgi:hypothetical protein